ncbi:MAG: alpha/beta fold hydrolase [bacterium]
MHEQVISGNMIEQWFAAGVPLRVEMVDRFKVKNSRTYNIFQRVAGTGPWLTFLHGYPTCSWDWHNLVSPLKKHFRLLMFDFLGFGFSEKPHNHHYSILEQADITVAIWKTHNIKKTSLIAHNYGDTVALELLSRQQEGLLKTQIDKVILLNGGVYVDYQHPLLIQRLLKMPAVGTVFSRFLNQRIFYNRFASIFSRAHPISEVEIEQYWHAIKHQNGHKINHRLIRYLNERKKYQHRWEDVLENTPVPTHFIWGLEDPVSGRDILNQIIQRMPHADALTLPDVGHYPQLEVPHVVANAILKKLA